MMTETFVSTPAPSVWQGRSGKRYDLSRVDIRAPMQAGALYALATDGIIVWAGTAQDLLIDPVSRDRFRREQTAASLMLSMPADGDPLDIMTIAWDLEGSHPASDRHAA